MTLKELETALDQGRVEVRMQSPYGGLSWAKVRRNGRTQTWKTRPGEFRIPVVHGLRTYGDINHIGARDPSAVRIVEA